MAENENNEEKKNEEKITEYPSSGTSYFNTSSTYSSMSSPAPSMNRPVQQSSISQFKDHMSYNPNVNTYANSFSSPQPSPSAPKTNAPKTNAPSNASSQKQNSNTSNTKNNTAGVCANPVVFDGNANMSRSFAGNDSTSTVDLLNGKTYEKVEIDPNINNEDMRKYGELKSDNSSIINLGRKEYGKDGYLYSIENVAKFPSVVQIEGYLLYEQKLDLKKYVESVTRFYDDVDLSTKDIAVATEALVTTGNESNSCTFELGSEAMNEKNKEKRVEESAVDIKNTTEELYSLLTDQDRKIFEDFNENLDTLKHGVCLKMLIEKANEINLEEKILDGPYTKYYPQGNFTLTPKIITRLDAGRVKEVRQGVPQTCYRDEDVKQYYKRTTIYRNIDLEGIMKAKEVSWNRKDDFYSQQKLLEKRFKEAGLEHLIPYKNKPGVITCIKDKH